MLTFAQFLLEYEDGEEHRWLLHPTKGTIMSRAMDKKGRPVLHWQMASQHDLPVGGPAFDRLERGGIVIKKDANGPGKHRVMVNSYGRSGRGAPVPNEVMRDVKDKYPESEVLDYN